MSKFLIFEKRSRPFVVVGPEGYAARQDVPSSWSDTCSRGGSCYNGVPSVVVGSEGYAARQDVPSS